MGINTIQSRRRFLQDTACGLGMIALSQLLAEEIPNPMAPKKPHFTPKAKNVIFLFMAGAPSQLDLYEPKPVMRRLHGEPVPDSLMKDLNDDLIRGAARVMASPREFKPSGNAGIEFSDYIPHIATCAAD